MLTFCLPSGQIAPTLSASDLASGATRISKLPPVAVSRLFSILQVGGWSSGFRVASYEALAMVDLESVSSRVCSSFHLLVTVIVREKPAQRAGGGIGSTTAYARGSGGRAEGTTIGGGADACPVALPLGFC